MEAQRAKSTTTTTIICNHTPPYLIVCVASKTGGKKRGPDRLAGLCSSRRPGEAEKLKLAGAQRQLLGWAEPSRAESSVASAAAPVLFVCARLRSNDHRRWLHTDNRLH